MCGIVGCIGYDRAREYLIDGLKTLDYRGYDSAGIALLEQGNIDIYKAKGTVEHLDSIIPSFVQGSLGIGHTRWATHGAPNDLNSHPHYSNDKKFALVHNGVIENYAEIKEKLIKRGYSFYSQTDSEVVVNLISSFYASSHDIQEAIIDTMKEIRGSYAIALLCLDDPNHLYLLKNSSPLLIGVADNCHFISSDASPMISYTNRFVELEDETFGIVSKDGIQLFDISSKKIPVTYTAKSPESCKRDIEGYPHFMLKEIDEIEKVTTRLLDTYCPNGEFHFEQALLEEIQNADKILFIACGTSYHASLVGVRYFESIGISASAYIASEWAFYPRISGKKPFVIMISQSGETADLIHCHKIAKEKGIRSLIVTNTKGSTLERACDYSCLLYAGLEVAVASTKAYVAQTCLLSLLVGCLQKKMDVRQDYEKAISVIRKIKNEYQSKIKDVADKLRHSHDFFYLGRGYDYDLSREASLKLKEVSYIHSEAIAGGELKHGPIALIEKGTPVFVFITDEITAASMRGNIQEVKARGADVYVISNASLSKEGDFIVLEDYPKYLSPVAASSIAFYFAYYVSLLKGLNVDKPRNLAKSVTVE